MNNGAAIAVISYMNRFYPDGGGFMFLLTLICRDAA
jgi:hypothetical protein